MTEEKTFMIPFEKSSEKENEVILNELFVFRRHANEPNKNQETYYSCAEIKKEEYVF